MARMPVCEASRSDRGKLGTWLLPLAALTMAGIGLERLLEDGSFWTDEAFIAVSLRDLPGTDLFGALGAGGNSFPRFYLLALQGVMNVFGYETLVLRALPFGFFLVASYVWLKLIFSRLRGFPLLAVLAFSLMLLATSWFAYSSMLKQYTFDVLLAALLFALPDRRLEATMRDGRQLWLAVALALPCALSYTYVIVLFGRLGGWWASQLSQGEYRLSVRGIVTTGACVLGALASLWLTDIQFMADSVYGWWATCTLGNDWSATPKVLDGFALGWYAGKQEFPIQGGLPEAVLWVLRGAFVLGVIQIARSLAGHTLYGASRSWGSRSTGALIVLLGLLGSSLLIDYPLCSGRLTLFALLPLQIVLFEGFAGAHGWIEESRNLKKTSLALGVLWLCLVVPFSLRDAGRFIRASAPENVRPAFQLIRGHGELSELPIHFMPCLRPLVLALPESDLDFDMTLVSSGASIPWGQQVLAIEREWHPGLLYCFKASAAYEKASTTWESLHADGDSVRVFLAGFPPEQP